MTRPPCSWYLLRGLGRESRHWFSFGDHLAALSGTPVVTVDLPGTGSRFTAPCPTSVERIAETLEIPPSPSPIGLVGISFGGMVALDFACLKGTAVSHVVLINSSSRLSPPSARLRPFGMLQLARALTETDVRKREEMIYSITLNGAENAVRRYAALGADIAESAPVSRLTAIRQLIAAGRYQPKRPLANCLALASSRDRLVDPGCSAALAAYLQCPLLVHPTGGHDLPVEDPRWVAARVQRWVWSAVEPQSKFAQTRVNS